MDIEEYLVAIQRESRALAAAALRDLDAPVPSCPGWSMTDLVAHQGRVHRWAAATVESRAQERVKAMERWDPQAEPDVVRWFEEGAARLLEVLRASDPDAPVWTFAGTDATRFWFRRQANETSIHRWDAELTATGEPAPIDAALAADGVDEMLTVLVPAFRRGGNGETFHFHRTDGDGEWLVTATPDGPVVERTHAKGDLAVRGGASDLILLLWNRIPADRLEVFGDEALLSRWFELANVD